MLWVSITKLSHGVSHKRRPSISFLDAWGIFKDAQYQYIVKSLSICICYETFFRRLDLATKHTEKRSVKRKKLKTWTKLSEKLKPCLENSETYFCLVQLYEKLDPSKKNKRPKSGNKQFSCQQYICRTTLFNKSRGENPLSWWRIFAVRISGFRLCRQILPLFRMSGCWDGWCAS